MARPLVDPWLAAADASLGVHVPSLTDWTAGHPWLNIGLQFCYGTLKIQFVAAAILLGLVYRDLARLWEYAFHFHFCLFVTVLALVFFPAECVFTYYGFESLLDQTRFIRQFEGFRSGALTAIRWDDLEGLISMPSFHVACGLMVTWSVRGIPWALLPVALLNLGLITATVMCGAHYFVDLVATVALFGLSILIYEKWISDAWDPFNRSSEGNGSRVISSGQGENSVSSVLSVCRHS